MQYYNIDLIHLYNYLHLFTFIFTQFLLKIQSKYLFSICWLFEFWKLPKWTQYQMQIISKNLNNGQLIALAEIEIVSDSS